MPKKRGHGEASYRERIINGSKYIEGRITINGKSYSRYAKTKSECRAKIDQLRFHGVEKKSDEYTVRGWIEKWLEEEVKLQRREKTYLNYKTIAKNHLIPVLGNFILSELSRKDIQSFVDRQKRNGLNPSTIKLQTTIFSTCLKLAVKDEILDKNPCQYLIFPQKEKTQRTWLSVNDLKKFLALDTSSDTKGNALKFSALTGLRRGEVLALKWSDVKFNDYTIAVAKSLTRTERGWEISKTKTSESVRTIPLSDEAIKILTLQKDITGNDTIIFSSPEGQILGADNLHHHLKHLLEQAGLPKVRVHDLRHSFASILHESGTDHKTLQALLGHANIQTTLNIYVHTDDQQKKKAAQTMNNLLK